MELKIEKIASEIVRKAIDEKRYTIREDSDCGCVIDWKIENGDLKCDVDADACYESKWLVIDGKDVARYVRYEGIEDETYAIESTGDKDEDRSLREEIARIIGISENKVRGESGDPAEHDSKKHHELVRFLDDLVENGWKLYRNNERGFANEYTCILVGPDADQSEIKDGWDALDSETWAKEFLYAGDATTEACVSQLIIE